MTYSESLIEASKTMTLLNNESGNWMHKFCFEDGKAVIYYIAKDTSQCGSGYFGDVKHIKRLIRLKTVNGNPLFDESSLTAEGHLLLEANGDQALYEKLLIEQSMPKAV